ncbi:GNAT family N-acetyltransferase [Candidatus Bipolaricaulota bacterium]|nr:GNAT family N-acetyltransferase [Candidatus Bipolaricaulota bacterium]
MSVDSGSPRVYLETERLTLRYLTEDDADNLFDLDSDPEVMRYLNNGRTHTRAEIADKILPHYLDHHRLYGDEYGFWAAIERSTGDLLGWFHFRPLLSAPEEIELGYRLKRSAWGQHYATEGSRGLIRKGFLDFGVPKIVADTLLANVRSRRVMEALGMTLESEFTLDAGEFPFWDREERRGVKYALRREEWEASGGANR